MCIIIIIIHVIFAVYTQVVVELCDERQDCNIKVNHRLFRQDPCPRIGKYVEVAYQCKPG